VTDDGGGALILVADERARDFPQKPVYLLGIGEAADSDEVATDSEMMSPGNPR
jgi:hypothetical protein